MNRSYLTKFLDFYRSLDSIPSQWETRICYFIMITISLFGLAYIPYSLDYPSARETIAFYVGLILLYVFLNVLGCIALYFKRPLVGKGIALFGLLLAYLALVLTIGVKDTSASVVLLVINVAFVFLINPFNQLVIDIPLLILGTMLAIGNSFALDSMLTAWLILLILISFSTFIRYILASREELVDLLKLLARIFYHDLKAYFEALQNFFTQLDDEYITLEEVRGLAKNAFNAFTLLKERVQTMVSIMIAATGSYTPNYKDVDVREKLTTMATTLAANAPEMKVEFDINFPIDQVLVDAAILDIAFHNLTTNAFKHGTSLVTIKGRIEVDKVVVEVIDDGKGIEKVDLTKIFNAGFQTQAGKEKGGTGLGLNFVKRLVAACKGEVWVESEVGKGSTFGFSLPFKYVA